jgi:hypothetical protein
MKAAFGVRFAPERFAFFRRLLFFALLFAPLFLPRFALFFAPRFLPRFAPPLFLAAMLVSPVDDRSPVSRKEYLSDGHKLHTRAQGAIANLRFSHRRIRIFSWENAGEFSFSTGLCGEFPSGESVPRPCFPSGSRSGSHGAQASIGGIRLGPASDFPSEN